MTINCRGNLLDLSSPKVMGILNCTRDSFYDGGKYTSVESIVARIDKMIEEGAEIIDIGGQSTRPNAKMLSADEEWKNVSFAFEYIAQNYPNYIISIDTFWSENLRKAYDYGVSIANDVSGASIDKDYFSTVAELQLPYVLMHSRGTPSNMQQLTHYDDLLEEINFYFSKKLAELRRLGVNDIILDPGIGFAKSISQNFNLLKNLSLFDFGDLPILLGISRKSFIYKSLDTVPEKILPASSALHLYALNKGVKILRVHDILEAKECISLYNQLHSA